MDVGAYNLESVRLGDGGGDMGVYAQPDGVSVCGTGSGGSTSDGRGGGGRVKERWG